MTDSLDAGRRGTMLELRANRPEVGEERLVQGGHEIGRPRRAAGPTPRSDGALDHLHVPVAPFLEPFVEITRRSHSTLTTESRRYTSTSTGCSSGASATGRV